MASMLERMRKSSYVDQVALLSKSEMHNRDSNIPLSVPAMNLAFSGRLDGGVGSGLHIFAGDSKTFKTNMSLVIAAGFQKKYPEGFILFYDSEGGANPAYWESLGVDPERVLHIVVTNLEELTFDLTKKLEEYKSTYDKKNPEKMFILVDSIGNLASKKEVSDVIDEKSTQDMTRAKMGKSFTRIVTSYLFKFDIPMIAIGHTYDTMEMYSKKILSGGKGWMYAANSVMIMGKRQIKGTDGIEGFEFILNAEKSRFIKEKSAIPITVKFDGGISKWSGLLDIAIITGHVVKPKNGWYTRPNVDGPEGKNWRQAATNSSEFWEPILEDKTFQDQVEKLYSLSSSKMVAFDEKEGQTILIDASPSETEKPGLFDGEEIDEETGEITTL